jgi:hypothetical protein
MALHDERQRKETRMEKQIPVESEGLGPLAGCIGVIRGVNDESAYLVKEFKPTLYELEVLARHYLEEARDIEFGWTFLGFSGSYEIRMQPFAYRRLATIQSILGDQRLQEAISRVEEKWDKRFAEAEEIEKNLEPCKSCGAKRDYYDYASPITDGYCGACDPATQGHSNLSGLPITLTEQEVESVHKKVEEIQRQTEAHISRMTGGPIE